MNSIRACIPLVLLVVISRVAYPAVANFDNERKGLVFGGDIGFSPYARQQHDGVSATKSGTCLSAFAGWGVSKPWSVNLQSSFMYYDVATSALSYQGFLGLTAHHFLKPDSLSMFVEAGVGMYAAHQARTWKTYTGPGAMLSIGQEMNRHVRISVSTVFGKANKVTYMQLSGQVGLIFY